MPESYVWGTRVLTWYARILLIIFLLYLNVDKKFGVGSSYVDLAGADVHRSVEGFNANWTDHPENNDQAVGAWYIALHTRQLQQLKLKRNLLYRNHQ